MKDNKTIRVEETIKRHLKEVEKEYQTGGLSEGFYADYATEVAKRTLTQHHQDLMREVVEKLDGMKANSIGDAIANSEGAFIPSAVEEAKEEAWNDALTKAQTIIKNLT